MVLGTAGGDHESGPCLLTLIVGITFGMIWLAAFWRNPRRAPLPVLVAPVAAALLGLGHWVAYDFSLSHWAGDFSLLQAIFNVGVAGMLVARRAGTPMHHVT